MLHDELTEISASAQPPAGCGVTLKAHQLALVRRALDFEEQRVPLSELRGLRGTAYDVGDERNADEYMRTRIGVIADRVGAGKSYVLLGIVAATKQRGETSAAAEPVMRSFASDSVLLSRRDPHARVGASLLVVPHNLCGQWAGYVRDFGCGLRVFYVSRSKHLDALSAVRDRLSADYDMVVVTNTFYNALATRLDRWRVKLRRVMYDEADSLAIASCASVDAGFHWFVTASYANLLYPRGHAEYDAGVGSFVTCASGVRSTGYIKTTFDDLSTTRDVARVLVLRNADRFVQASMELPEPCVRCVRCATPASIRLLSGVVDKNIMDCLNAGDLATAMQLVGRATEDNIVAALVEKLTRQARALESRIAMIHRVEFENEDERESELRPLQRRKLEVDAKVACISERVRGSDTCCICYDAIENKSVAPCCVNAFCFRCINTWLSRAPTCPLCKADLAPSQLMLVDATARASLPVPASDVPANKIDALDGILRDRAAGSKFLIFSAFDNTFDDVERVLRGRGLRSRYLKGNHFVVDAIVSDYRTRDLDVLLVNPTHYGNGLNFENTTDVIMFHKFDSEIEKQVLGRALRCGRTKPLTVWYLLFDSEMAAASVSLSA